MAPRGSQEDGGCEDSDLDQSISSHEAGLSAADETQQYTISVSRIKDLKDELKEHCDVASKILISGRDSIEKRSQVESAFRACKEAFDEVSTVLIYILESNFEQERKPDYVKRAIIEALTESNILNSSVRNDGRTEVGASKRTTSYASIVSEGPRIHVSRGPTVQVPKSTSFLIVPDVEASKNLSTSAATKDALSKVFRPADCALKIKKITPVKGNAIKIEAFSPDLDSIKSHPGLRKAGLTVQENVKFHPRLVVHGIPANMSPEEIRNEVIAQNLLGKEDAELRVVYIYPIRKENTNLTSCVLEVSPEVRNAFLANGRIFLRYSACRFADHVWIPQCYRCLAFGHLAAKCKSDPRCGHCAGNHEMKNCSKRDEKPKCCNCAQNKGLTLDDTMHSAIDAKKCQILCKRIKDKLANINYG